MARYKIYNAEQKERFMSESGLSEPMESIFRNVFDFIAPYEERLGCDISTWDVENVQRVYNLLSGFRSASANNRVLLIKRYVRWCIRNHTDGAREDALSLKADNALKARDILLSGPDHLEKCLSSFLDAAEERTSDNVLRGYCWLAFSGMSERDAVSVVCEDVEIEKYTITCNGVKYPVYPESYECMMNLRDIYAFRYVHPLYSDDSIWRPRAEGNKLLRGIKSPEPKINNIRSILSRRVMQAYNNGTLPIKLSYYRVWISGEFYRMYMAERSGAVLDFSRLAEQATRVRADATERHDTDSSGHTRESRMKEKAQSFKTDYDIWKRVYGL